jgi:methylmalonyl-CoA mutase
MTNFSVSQEPVPDRAKHKVRFVTAASLFDGHDASIYIMRSILQASGCGGAQRRRGRAGPRA